MSSVKAAKYVAFANFCHILPLQLLHKFREFFREKIESVPAAQYNI